MIAVVDLNALFILLPCLLFISFGIWSLRNGKTLIRGQKPMTKADSPLFFWMMISFWFGMSIFLLFALFKKLLK